MSERMSLVVFSGTADKLMAAATLATGGAMMGMEVDLFLTFWGLEALKKGAPSHPPRISAEYADYAPVMFELMHAKNVPHWLDTIRAAREIGDVHIYACSATMELFGYTLDDLDPVVDEVTGVGSFVEQAREAKITMFI